MEDNTVNEKRNMGLNYDYQALFSQKLSINCLSIIGYM